MSTVERVPKDPQRELLPKSPLPKVEIISITTPPDQGVGSIASSPIALAAASARTCYSSRGIYLPERYRDPNQRKINDQVVESTRKAGHLTTRQHYEVVFGIANISRRAIWSFFHNHPFYNSEQVSQRYVPVEKGKSFVPPLEGKALELYQRNAQEQIEAYQSLKEILAPVVAEEYYRIFPKRKDESKWQKTNQGTIEKKAQEVARYVLGIDTFAYLYHTINTLTLMRYHRACQLSDVPLEAKLVVQEMVNRVTELYPDFLREIEDPYPIAETPEYQALNSFRSYLDFKAASSFNEEFDRNLRGAKSRLVDWNANGERTLAQAVRNILGLTRNRLDDQEAIEMVLNPAKNQTLGESLNLTTLEPVSRALHSISYTMAKKISHTADSQDQRHRTVPGARPILATQFSGEPDYITPALIKQSPSALKVYQEIMEKTFMTINQLFEMGVSPENALYRLPNAFPIRFTEAGNLLFYRHKVEKRLCFNAQREIWQTVKEEVKQISRVHPSIGKWLAAPCRLRREANTTPFCPEGSRFCGQKIWEREGVVNYPERII